MFIVIKYVSSIDKRESVCHVPEQSVREWLLWVVRQNADNREVRIYAYAKPNIRDDIPGIVRARYICGFGFPISLNGVDSLMRRISPYLSEIYLLELSAPGVDHIGIISRELLDESPIA